MLHLDLVAITGVALAAASFLATLWFSMRADKFVRHQALREAYRNLYALDGVLKLLVTELGSDPRHRIHELWQFDAQWLENTLGGAFGSLNSSTTAAVMGVRQKLLTSGKVGPAEPSWWVEIRKQAEEASDSVNAELVAMERSHPWLDVGKPKTGWRKAMQTWFSDAG